MKQICVMEPLAVSEEALRQLMAPLADAGYDIVVHHDKETDEEKLLGRIKDAEVLVLANQLLPASVVAQCEHLRMISVGFTGVDHIPLDVCREKGIVVCNAAGYATNAVAELTLALTIGVMRNMVPCDGRTRAGQTKDGLVGPELWGKTFGVIGMGAIGTRVAHLAKAFGCDVKVYNRTERPEFCEAGFTVASVDDICESCDVVSLHVPLTADTKHLIDERRLGLMKPTAYLINTARGPVVDMDALGKALHDGKLAGAGIDVFDIEPPLPTDNVLCQAPHTLLTPHIGFASHESFLVRAEIVAKNISCWLRGEPQNSVF